jgi:tetratricopeptide (TPR) repeat protein
LLALAQIQQELGQREEALKHYTTVVSLRPTDFDLLITISSLLFELEHATDALTILEQALLLRPNGEPVAFTNQGLVLHSLNRYSNAIKSFELSLRLRPNDWSTRLALATSLTALGAADIAAAIATATDNSTTTEIEAPVDLTNARRGADLYITLCKERPDDLDLILECSDALATAQRFDDAKSYLDIAMKAKPDDVDVWIQRGVILEKMGQTRQALRALELALEKRRYDVPLLWLTASTWWSHAQQEQPHSTNDTDTDTKSRLLSIDKCIRRCDDICSLDPEHQKAEQLRDTAKTRKAELEGRNEGCIIT